MSYGTNNKGAGYGGPSRKGFGFRSKKKQKFAEQIRAEKNRLTDMIANGDVGDSPYHHGHVEGQIRALEWVENKIPSDVDKPVAATKDPVKVQCPRDGTVFEPVVGKSYDKKGRGIWCPKCGATFNEKPDGKWSTSDGSLKILE